MTKAKNKAIVIAQFSEFLYTHGHTENKFRLVFAPPIHPMTSNGWEFRIESKTYSGTRFEVRDTFHDYQKAINKFGYWMTDTDFRRKEHE